MPDHIQYSSSNKTRGTFALALQYWNMITSTCDDCWNGLLIIFYLWPLSVPDSISGYQPVFQDGHELANLDCNMIPKWPFSGILKSALCQSVHWPFQAILSVFRTFAGWWLQGIMSYVWITGTSRKFTK